MAAAGVALAIARGLAGGIGGSLSQAAQNYGNVAKKVGSKSTDNSQEMYNSGYKIGNLGMDEVEEELLSKLKANKSDASKKDDTVNTSDTTSTTDTSSSTETVSTDIGSSGSTSAASDVDLKSIYGDSIDDKIIENFAKIKAIDFHYKPDAQEEYQGEYGVDNQEHIGIKAQDLQDNEATKGTVSENENGDLIVDTRHLTFADTAAIGELSRRILVLENIVQELQKNR